MTDRKGYRSKEIGERVFIEGHVYSFPMNGHIICMHALIHPAVGRITCGVPIRPDEMMNEISISGLL